MALYHILKLFNRTNDVRMIDGAHYFELLFDNLDLLFFVLPCNLDGKRSEKLLVVLSKALEDLWVHSFSQLFLQDICVFKLRLFHALNYFNFHYWISSDILDPLLYRFLTKEVADLIFKFAGADLLAFLRGLIRAIVVLNLRMVAFFNSHPFFQCAHAWIKYWTRTRPMDSLWEHIRVDGIYWGVRVFRCFALLQ